MPARFAGCACRLALLGLTTMLGSVLLGCDRGGAPPLPAAAASQLSASATTDDEPENTRRNKLGDREKANGAVSGNQAPNDPRTTEASEVNDADHTPEPNHGESEPQQQPANRLAKETSPYLLMHAHNPVDWYPWGPEAFERARRENKPIFLSVGYASCHWCHVMERESFRDPEIAAFLNEHFISIKVDREERPDVDQIYMTALQVYNQLTGSQRGGGWPMSMFLLPDGRPFFGGTYFPPRDGPRGVGFLSVLRRIHEVWRNEPDRLKQQAEQLTKITVATIDEQPAGPKQLPASEQIAARIEEALFQEFDAEYGGFGYSEVDPNRPKFPVPSNLLFLLDRWRRDRTERAKTMLTTTLAHMAGGGIHDQVGGGFHRYSTDRYWRVPHFEKMLYDNGQLATLYAEAFASFGRLSDRRTVERLVDFVLRELTSPEGAFYSSLGAETGGHEGAYYVWTRQEIEAALSDDQFQLVRAVYGLDQEPNFEGRYVLCWSAPPDEIAKSLGLDEATLFAQLDAAHKTLLEVRGRRERPRTDTKIVTAWNGLMIRGLADAGRVLKRPQYVQAAARAAEFVWSHLRQDDNRLLRSYAGGQAKWNAYLDDYAMLTDGLLALHQADGSARWLERAQQLADRQIDLFWDERRGGFFFTSDDHEALFARPKDPVDSALPSGNAVSAHNLIRLSRLLKRSDYRQRAEQTILALAWGFDRSPAAMPRMATALMALDASRSGNAAD